MSECLYPHPFDTYSGLTANCEDGTYTLPVCPACGGTGLRLSNPKCLNGWKDCELPFTHRHAEMRGW